MDLEDVRLIKSDSSWLISPFNIILMLLLASALGLTISGTIYQIYYWEPYLKREEQNNLCQYSEKEEMWKTNNRNIQESAELLHNDNNLNDCKY